MKQCYNPLRWKQMSEFDSSVHKRIGLKRTVCTQIVNAACASGRSDWRIVQCSKNGASHWVMWCDSCQPVRTDNQSDRILQITRGSGNVSGLIQIHSFLFKSSEQKNCVSLATLLPGQKPQEPVSYTGLQILTASTLTFYWAVHVQRYFNI